MAHTRRTALAWLCLGLTGRAVADAPVRVAAASDLKFALGDIASGYTAATGRTVALSFGSSGNFARQIEQGAPIDLFMSADEAFVQHLAAAGLTPDDGARYAVGRISLIAPASSPLPLDERLAGLADARLERFAIANPEHAPYGRAAREALQAIGLWPALQPRLVLGENVAQAMQYVATGAAPAGIGALSLALRLTADGRLRHAAISDTLHSPLHQRMVLIGRTPAAPARAFFEYLLQPAARAQFERNGFRLPAGAR